MTNVVPLFAMGAFWTLSAIYFGWEMAQGRFDRIKALHRDLSPDASNGAWWLKNVALGLVGVLWVADGVALGLRSEVAGALTIAAAVAIAVEQLAMPLLSPGHWKSYTGVLVGLVLGGAVLWLGGLGASLREWLFGWTLVLSALFVGSLCFIAIVVLPAASDRSVFDLLTTRADRVMPWLGRALAGSLVALVALRHGAWPVWLALASLAFVFAVSFSVNVPINRDYRAHGRTLSEGDLAELRRRWRRGHQTRTLGGLVLLVSLVGEALR